MDYRNEANVEPGTYVDAQERVVVVVDFITHRFNPVVGMVEALADREIVVRPLVQLKEHVREVYPSEIFKNRFTKC